jgi:CheY-like chemotaxis protein
MNICLNGLDAMPDGGTLTLRTAIPRPDWVEVSVEDTGAGMVPEILARVTEPFYTTKPVGKGTGLGLSVTHGVLKAHGGTMEISSQAGKGTQVRLRLPRLPVHGPETAVEGPPPLLGAVKILLVDDDEQVRFLMTRMLRRAGATEVSTAPGGREAIDSLASGSLPDLVILDQNMPGLDGLQTLALIREQHPELPVLISSGQPDIQDWEALKQRNVGIISKPFTLEEILEKLAGMPGTE